MPNLDKDFVVTHKVCNNPAEVMLYVEEAWTYDDDKDVEYANDINKIMIYCRPCNITIYPSFESD